MYRLKFFTVFLILVFTACKKDHGNPTDPSSTCMLDDHPKETRLTFSGLIGQDIDPRAIDLKLWEDGWVALFLKDRDSVYIYDSDLNLQTGMAVPGAQGIICLSNQTLLTIFNQSKPLGFHVDGEVSAYQEVGRDFSCQRIYSYTNQGSYGYQVLEAITELSSYDRQGSQLYNTQLTGYVADENPEQAVTELNGKVYLAVASQDTIRTSLVLEGGVFQDTLRNNSDDTELWLYQIDDQGTVVDQKMVTNILTYFPRVMGRLVGNDGNLWYSSQYEILRINQSGIVLSRSFNPKQQCAERIREFLNYKNGVLIRSSSLNSSDEYWYSLNSSLNPVDFQTSSMGYTIGVNGEDVYVFGGGRAVNATTANVVWEPSTGYDLAEPSTFRVGCNGKLYGIAYKLENGVTRQYLVKAN